MQYTSSFNTIEAILKKIFVFTLLAVASSVASAGASSGTISSYLVSRYGKLFFVAGPTDNSPSCSGAGHWAVDLVGPDAAAGKAILAAVIAAQMSGKRVFVQGKCVCDVWGDRETVDYISVET